MHITSKRGFLTGLLGEFHKQMFYLGKKFLGFENISSIRSQNLQHLNVQKRANCRKHGFSTFLQVKFEEKAEISSFLYNFVTKKIEFIEN